MTPGQVRLGQAIHTNLLVLDFDSFLRKESKGKNMEFLRELSNTPDLFLTQDKRPFHAVTYFLLNCLSHAPVHAKWLRDLKACFPCVDRAMETDFRKVTANVFSSLEKETDFHFKKMPFATILMNPGKEPFLHLYLKLTAFVLTKQSSPDERAIIRSLKSHQPVDETMRENVTALIRSQGDVAVAKAHLCSLIVEHRQKFMQCAQERNQQREAADSVATEWQSVFSGKDDAEDTCGAYIEQVTKLRDRPSLRTPHLLTQLESDLDFCSRRTSLIRTCSGIDVVNRMRDWGKVGQVVAADVRKDDFIIALCHRNSSADSFVQKTDSDVATILKEIDVKRLNKSERSLSLRQTVLKSDCMALTKKQIADQMGLHSWLNLNMSPVPVPADGARRWREREKQRQAVRQSQAAVPAKRVDLIPSEPQSPLTPNHNDSLNNFSLFNATVEMSRFSMLDLSTNTPDFLLDTSVHLP